PPTHSTLFPYTTLFRSLGKYGLLEGRGDENRVSDLAVAIIAHEPGTSERVAALQAAASKPELFAEIDQRFSGGKGSDTAIRSYLDRKSTRLNSSHLVIS